MRCVALRCVALRCIAWHGRRCVDTHVLWLGLVWDEKEEGQEGKKEERSGIIITVE